MCRRLVFLHYIISEEPDCLIARFFKAQVKNPDKNDWCLTVEEDLKDLGITLKFDEIRNMTEMKFKSFVKAAIVDRALTYLNHLKSSHSKVLHIENKSLAMQEYMKPKNVIGSQVEKFLFQAKPKC